MKIVKRGRRSQQRTNLFGALGTIINNYLELLMKMNTLFFSSPVTLTHACNTPWAQNCYVETSTPYANVVGLTDFGKEVVREMNRFLPKSI
jgi:microsomal dipeptidase-like Zn-dependent dipeptidase